MREHKIVSVQTHIFEFFLKNCLACKQRPHDKIQAGTQDVTRPRFVGTEFHNSNKAIKLPVFQAIYFVFFFFLVYVRENKALLLSMNAVNNCSLFFESCKSIVSFAGVKLP